LGLLQRDMLEYKLVTLLIFYISDDVQEAYNLIKDLEPSTPQVVGKLSHFY
jgi:hypothetical protein